MFYNIKDAREALDNMDDYARMDTGVNAIGPMKVLTAFLDHAERVIEANHAYAETNAKLLGRALAAEKKLLEIDNKSID